MCKMTQTIGMSQSSFDRNPQAHLNAANDEAVTANSTISLQCNWEFYWLDFSFTLNTSLLSFQCS